jgi:hypothetical protein
MVKSRFSLRFYYPLFFVLLGLLILFFDHDTYSSKGKYSLPGTIIFVIATVYFLSRLINNGKIRLKYDEITITGLLINIKIDTASIIAIHLFEKREKTCTRIILGNGKELIINDWYYSNINEIKQFLVDTFRQKIVSFNNETTIPPSPETPEIKIFSDDPYYSIDAVLIYAMLPLLLLILISDISIVAKLGTIAASTGYVYFKITQFNYFILTEKQLIVKNFFIGRLNKVYDITNIVTISFEYPYFLIMSRYHRYKPGLRIIEKNFHSKFYGALSLEKKTIEELRKSLEKMQIQVL